MIYSLLLTLCILLGASLSQNCPAPIKVHETEIVGEVYQFKWLAPAYTRVFAHTLATEVYLSKDEGQSWVSQASKLTNFSYVHNINGQLLHGVVDMEPSAADNNVVYFLGWEGFLWVTRDGGNTYNYYRTNPNWRTIKLHPTKPGWMLGLGLTERCVNRAASGNCYTELYLSKDFGVTWRLIETYVNQFEWANAGLYGVNENSVWILDFSQKTGNQADITRDKLEFRNSIDYFTTSTSFMEKVVAMLHWRENTFVARESPNNLGLELWVSEDNGVTFNLAEFPFKDALQENGYVILDDSEGAAFVFVIHDTFLYGNLYSSDKFGSKFDLVMENESRDRVHIDFIKMLSLNRIYFANQYQVEDQGQLKTASTFDLGGNWEMIGVPTGMDGNPVPCEGQCNLHLHTVYKRPPTDTQGARTNFGPLYSNENAVGLIMGTGNVVGDDLNDANTYLSRDGGWRWRQVLSGSQLYEMADHGSLILAADNVRDTSTISYSTDEGLSWQSCAFTTTASPIDITNIIAKPSLTSQSFLLHGKRRNSTTNQVMGYLIHADFTGILPRQCADTDYEVWCPSDSVGSGGSATCLLGQATCYKRRRQGAQCFNGAQHEPVVSQTQCVCSQNDYECDECFMPSGFKGQCTPDPACDNPYGVPSPCEGSYQRKSGYRLNAGTTCNPVGGPDLGAPISTSCDSLTTTQGQDSGAGGGGANVGAIVGSIFAVLCCLGSVGGAAFWLRTHPEHRLYVTRKLGLDDDVFAKIATQNRRNYEREGTALDEDLLEDKEAVPIDDSVINDSFKN